jgi:hypothetical protein
VGELYLGGGVLLRDRKEKKGTSDGVFGINQPDDE